jgi:hypothetical protein
MISLRMRLAFFIRRLPRDLIGTRRASCCRGIWFRIRYAYTLRVCVVTCSSGLTAAFARGQRYGFERQAQDNQTLTRNLGRHPIGTRHRRDRRQHLRTVGRRFDQSLGMSAHIAQHCNHSQHCNPSDNHQHCNATGSYSSFAGNDPNTPFRDLVDAKNITINGTFGQDLSVRPPRIRKKDQSA